MEGATVWNSDRIQRSHELMNSTKGGTDRMRKRITALLAAGGAAALTVGLTAAPSFATAKATWTVSPGGNITVTGSAQVKDTKTGTIAKCTSLKLGGTLKTGS